MPTVICEIIWSIIMLPCFPCIYDQTRKTKYKNQLPNRVGFGTSTRNEKRRSYSEKSSSND